MFIVQGLRDVARHLKKLITFFLYKLQILKFSGGISVQLMVENGSQEKSMTRPKSEKFLFLWICLWVDGFGGGGR